MEPRRAPEITILEARMDGEDDRLDRELWTAMPPEERVLELLGETR